MDFLLQVTACTLEIIDFLRMSLFSQNSLLFLCTLRIAFSVFCFRISLVLYPWIFLFRRLCFCMSFISLMLDFLFCFRIHRDSFSILSNGMYDLAVFLLVYCSDLIPVICS